MLLMFLQLNSQVHMFTHKLEQIETNWNKLVLVVSDVCLEFGGWRTDRETIILEIFFTTFRFHSDYIRAD